MPVPYHRRRVFHRVDSCLSVFLPPWAGKFASDSFHPSQDGYRDWARALLAAIPPSVTA
jgi:lysophospholipase L1-like esterase